MKIDTYIVIDKKVLEERFNMLEAMDGSWAKGCRDAIYQIIINSSPLKPILSDAFKKGLSAGHPLVQSMEYSILQSLELSKTFEEYLSTIKL